MTVATERRTVRRMTHRQPGRRLCAIMGTLSAALLALVGCSEGAPSATGPGATTTTEATTAAATTTPVAAEGRLLFSRFNESTHTFLGTYTARADGTEVTEIPMPGPEGGGRWSRSGRQIAVMTVLDDGRIGTAILSPDGTVTRVLEIADPTLNLVCTVWSRDDARLACEGFDETDDARNGIYTVRAEDGADLQRLTTPPEGMADSPGDFAPGGRFVFKRYVGDEAPGPLMLVGASGGEPRTLVDSSMEDPGRFSPDGQLILTSSGGVVLVLDLDGTVTQEIADSGAFLFGPTWSPDGELIAFSSAASGPFADIFISRPDGTDRQRVTQTTENEVTIDWTVDAG